MYSVNYRSGAPRNLHLLDLVTGKDVVITRATGSGYDAAMSARGLVYAVDSRSTGKLVFVPTAKLPPLSG